jgi:hypothetical protein
MEIVNKLDNESQSDRILWDNILMRTMPHGRAVWGFSDDDAHHIASVGFSFNVMLMDKDDFRANGSRGMFAYTQQELNIQSADNPIRRAMTNGAFYAVSRVDKKHRLSAT